ncbi:heme ABC exporter ATP-binding protein CcmA [Taklimakanibacter lacteus]|uniref:heme ABC exporter ATP-binding protein CcmA n=1 Tax=Taklimakanibacter lacteus TaxID=2268456 RepID=UPI000E66589D
MVQLCAEALACQRGGRVVFTDVNFALASGQLLELRGPNGAGKSSLLRLIAGLGEAAQGAISLTGGSPELSIGQQAHYGAHQEAIKTPLTVRENLQFWGDFLGGGDLAAALAAFDLEDLGEYPAALLSAGQKRRLSLSRLALVPRLLWLLDEPTLGLDQASLERLMKLLRGHLSGGGLAVVATHTPLALTADVTLMLGAPA